MKMFQSYNFITEWLIEAPLEDVRDTLFDVSGWSQWWKGVQSVKHIDGDTYQFVLGYLGYRVHFTAQISQLDEHTLKVEATSGDLKGLGEITVEPNDKGTKVTITWDVEDQRRWTQVQWIRPLLIWAHDKAMQWGERGLSQVLSDKKQ